MGEFLHLRRRHLDVQWGLLYQTMVRFEFHKIRSGDHNTRLMRYRPALYEGTELHKTNPKWMPYFHLQLFEDLSPQINAALEKGLCHITRYLVPFCSDLSQISASKTGNDFPKPLSVSLAVTRTPGISPIRQSSLLSKPIRQWALEFQVRVGKAYQLWVTSARSCWYKSKQTLYDFHLLTHVGAGYTTLPFFAVESRQLSVAIFPGVLHAEITEINRWARINGVITSILALQSAWRSLV